MSDYDMAEFIVDFVNKPKEQFRSVNEEPFRSVKEEPISPFNQRRVKIESAELSQSSQQSDVSPSKLPESGALTDDEIKDKYTEVTGGRPHGNAKNKGMLRRIRKEFPYFGKAPDSGSGIRPTTDSASLGKICISPDKLYYDNMLVVKTHDGNHLTGFRNKKVSDAFVSLVFKLIKKEPLTKLDYALPLGERELFDALIHIAKLHKSVETNGFAPMKKRLELIEGEIEAGNTNHELISEAYGILQKLAHSKVITHTSAKNHIIFLKSLGNTL